MVDFGLNFHHLGLAVNQEKETLVFLEGMGYSFGDKIYDPEQNVHLRLCTAVEKPDIEIIIPGLGSGPLDQYLKRYNEIIYHTCYEVDSLQQTMSAFDSAGLRVITKVEPKSAILFSGRKVSFYQVKGFGLIELLEIT